MRLRCLKVTYNSKEINLILVFISFREGLKKKLQLLEQNDNHYDVSIQTVRLFLPISAPSHFIFRQPFIMHTLPAHVR